MSQRPAEITKDFISLAVATPVVALGRGMPTPQRGRGVSAPFQPGRGARGGFVHGSPAGGAGRPLPSTPQTPQTPQTPSSTKKRDLKGLLKSEEKKQQSSGGGSLYDFLSSLGVPPS